MGLYRKTIQKTLSLYRKPYGNLTKFLYLSCTSIKQKSPNSLTFNQLRIKALFVRAKGIEPIRLSAPDPKSGLSTNFNTPATCGLQMYDNYSDLQKFYRDFYLDVRSSSGSIITFEPIETYLTTFVISSLLQRMQPSVDMVPMDSGKHVPWIPMLSKPGTVRRMK